MSSVATRSMSNLTALQSRLSTLGLDGLLVPSTDEYSSEFAQPFARRLRWVTGFTGSTGLAVVLRDRAVLFLDGRYRPQGRREIPAFGIEVLDASETTRQRWLADNLPAGRFLGVDGNLHSYAEVRKLRAFAAEHGITVTEVTTNPIDELWAQRPAVPRSTILDYPVQFSGLAARDKCKHLTASLQSKRLQAYFVADPEDVAWLLNVRTHDSRDTPFNDWHIVPIPLTRALIEATGDIFWFVERSRLEPRLRRRVEEDRVTVLDPDQTELFLAARLKGKSIGANLSKTPHRFAATAATVGCLIDDRLVAQNRWRKHPQEIQCARAVHHRDGQAVIRFLAWLQRTIPKRGVTELDAARKLTEFRDELDGYLGISEPLMSASGPNTALPHYVPSEQSNRRLNDHPIYWVDSGGQYYGCSTDNTVCMAVGVPEERHIRAHTLVVKGAIALATARFPAGIHSTQLDSFARQYLWQAGLDYEHGTSHGVGNFMNVHEGPYIRSDPGHPLAAPIEVGMVISNEPGCYVPGDFGIRVESHLVTVQSAYPGFLEFETLSRLPVDPCLLDQTLLTASEKCWLAGYHAEIAQSYKGCFDEDTARWLRSIVDRHVSAAV